MVLDNDESGSEDCIRVSRKDFEGLVAKVAKEEAKKAVRQIGEDLTSDLQDALRAINDELGRFGNRLKKLEAWISDADADAKAKLNYPRYVTEDQYQVRGNTETKTEKQKRKETRTNAEAEENASKHNESDDSSRANQTNGGVKATDDGLVDCNEEEDGWTLVRNKKKRNKVRRNGAVMICGQNVGRVKAAAMEEFIFDQNVSFVTTSSDDFNQSLRTAIQRSKAKEVEVVIHSGAEDILQHSSDYVLEKLTNMVDYARQLPKVKTVSVCSVEERRDAGSTVHQNVKISTQNSPISASRQAPTSLTFARGYRNPSLRASTERAYFTLLKGPAM